MNRKGLVAAVLIWSLVILLVAINFFVLPHITAPIDLCFNLVGVQTVVPAGLTHDGQGNCFSLRPAILDSMAIPEELSTVSHWGREADLIFYHETWWVTTDAGFAIVIMWTEVDMTLVYVPAGKTVSFGRVRPHVGLLGHDERPSVMEFRSETEAWEYASGMVDAFSEYDPQIVWEES